MEALQLHSNTESHWSNGSTVCFRLDRQGRPGDAPTLTIEPGSPVKHVLLQHYNFYNDYDGWEGDGRVGKVLGKSDERGGEREKNR